MLLHRPALSVAIVLMAALMSTAGLARAGDTKAPRKSGAAVAIDAFYGDWRGTALAESEDSLYFALTQRDVSVSVTPVKAPKGGFSLSWSTVQRKKGDPVDPVEEVKETAVTFEPGERPNLWWDVKRGDPASGETLRWARIDGRTLIINTVTMRRDGSLESQTYRRTLTGKGMALSFSRVLDGKEVRSVSGQLTKQAQ